MRVLAWMSILALAGCMTATPPPEAEGPPLAKAETVSGRIAARKRARQFTEVIAAVEPVAERECRRRAPEANCDFLIAVGEGEGLPANALQFEDDTGRPVIGFTLALIAEARNADELAFIMGHEAAHHIAGHLLRQERNAAIGAEAFARLAARLGAEPDRVQSAQALGAAVGARSYSKTFELEADALGTLITKRAGYDPVKGADFFTRLPDPGNRFLGTHPPNASRIETVRRVAAEL